jgi:transposase InsO family protein
MMHSQQAPVRSQYSSWLILLGFSAPRSAERFVGSVRRELLDHVVVLSKDHLRRLLREYVDYYNAERVHTSIGGAPAGRALEHLVALPRVGGLHHRYGWGDAA